MSNTAPSIDSIVESFPHPTIPPIVGLPTYESINAALKLLNANAASVPSSRGNAAFGHLALTIGPATYQTLAGVAWTNPANPGHVPEIAHGLTAAQIAALTSEFKENLYNYKLFANTDAALKKLHESGRNALNARELRVLKLASARFRERQARDAWLGE